MEQDLATEPTADTAEKQKPAEDSPAVEQAAAAAAPQSEDNSAPAEVRSPEPRDADVEPASAAPVVESSEKPQPAPGLAAPRPSPPAPTSSLAEHWSNNERMRHVPACGWIAEKIDHDVRQRLEILASVLGNLPTADPRFAPVEQALRGVCNALDLLAHAARHSRAATPPNELASRISWSLNNAASSVRAIDANNFGRRYPFQTFERSKAEFVYAALLVVLDRVHRSLPLFREVDPSLDERLLQGLVNLQTPMRQEKIA